MLDLLAMEDYEWCDHESLMLELQVWRAAKLHLE